MLFWETSCASEISFTFSSSGRLIESTVCNISNMLLHTCNVFPFILFSFDYKNQNQTRTFRFVIFFLNANVALYFFCLEPHIDATAFIYILHEIWWREKKNIEYSTDKKKQRFAFEIRALLCNTQSFSWNGKLNRCIWENLKRMITWQRKKTTRQTPIHSLEGRFDNGKKKSFSYEM